MIISWYAKQKFLKQNQVYCEESNEVDKGLVSNYSPETGSVYKHWPVVEFSLPAYQNIYGKQDDNRLNHFNCHFEIFREKVL